jgi:fructose/tagatose bisphosphate aldolase
MTTNVEQKVVDIFKNSASYENGKVFVKDEAAFRKDVAKLAEISAIGAPELKGFSRFCIRSAAENLGIYPASIHELYMGKGRGDVPLTFSVPAMNLRVLAFDAARIVFKTALKVNGSAFIFEIARSEMVYTDQKPGEYASSILAAAIAEGYRGPVFIQGDHFQASLKKMETLPDVEIKVLKNLIKEAVAAGFFNIDIDTSTLVDLNKTALPEQQAKNVGNSALFTDYIRSHEPANVTISVGGEIGEVGGHNSTEIELRTYLNGFNKALLDLNPKAKGLSKISVQTGTSHGGVVLADGSIAKVSVDFDTLRNLSRVARKDYGLGGTVQHGASTLPEEAFGKFVENEACEVHLATNFVNMFFDLIPQHLKEEMYAYLDKECASDRKPDMTNEQFYYKTRKNTIGVFKEKSWKLSPEQKAPILNAWETQFTKLFHLLGVKDTKKYVDHWIPKTIVEPKLVDYVQETTGLGDIKDLAD